MLIWNQVIWRNKIKAGDQTVLTCSNLVPLTTIFMWSRLIIWFLSFLFYYSGQVLLIFTIIFGVFSPGNTWVPIFEQYKTANMLSILQTPIGKSELMFLGLAWEWMFDPGALVILPVGRHPTFVLRGENIIEDSVNVGFTPNTHIAANTSRHISVLHCNL